MINNVYDENKKFGYSYTINNCDMRLNISVQKGCPMDCSFCKMSNNYEGSIDSADLYFQIKSAIRDSGLKEIRHLYIGYDKSGEATFNPSVLTSIMSLHYNGINGIDVDKIYITVSTMMPKGNPILKKMLLAFANIKEDSYKGDLTLKLNIDSTDENQRDTLFGGKSLSIEEISELTKDLFYESGSKHILSFLLYNDSMVDPKIIDKYFNKDIFRIVLSPMQENSKTIKNELEPFTEDNKFEDSELTKSIINEFISLGWDVSIVNEYPVDFGKDYKNEINY
jgi:adenine C2-methylase RlmN of 23S rRNA A2503 and tRNA A37